jgi:hypothetical protein
MGCIINLYNKFFKKKILFLKQKIENNNFLSHNLTTNSKNTTSASPLVTRRLGNQKKGIS